MTRPAAPLPPPSESLPGPASAVPESSAARPRPLSESLRHALSGTGDVTLGALVDAVGEKGFGLLLMVLSLPSALPVPATGYSTPFGLVFLVLGFQMLCGRLQPWLPQRARRLALKRSLADKTLQAASKLLGLVERIVRPRLAWLNRRPGAALMSLVVLVMAALMSLPIPATNTFPALVIFLVGAGLSEKDGLLCLGACLLGAVSLLLYAVLLYFFATMGMEGIEYVKDAVKSLI